MNLEDIPDKELRNEFERREKEKRDHYAREYEEKQRKWLAELNARTLGAARAIVPDLTEEQFGQLTDLFGSYWDEIRG